MNGSVLGWWVFLVGLPTGAVDVLLLVLCWVSATARVSKLAVAVCVVACVEALFLAVIGLLLSNALPLSARLLQSDDRIDRNMGMEDFMTAIFHLAALGAAVAIFFLGKRIYRMPPRSRPRD